MKRTRWNHSLRLATAVAAIAVTLSACHDKNPVTPVASKTDTSLQQAAELAQAKKNLLDGVSGVWKPYDGDGLLTVYAATGTAQMAEGNEAMNVTLGDVDPENQTVVMKVIGATRNELRTLKLVADGDSSTALQITDGDGGQASYSFLRKISKDDLTSMSTLKAAAPALTAAPTPPAATSRGVINMYLGGIDMNMRSCPGSTCAPVIVVPKDSKISADTSTIRNVTEASGVNTPWVRVTYEGAYCTPAELDQQTGCTPNHGTEAPVTGWMNYTRLLDAPRPQQ
jgi:hypothetical protein